MTYFRTFRHYHRHQELNGRVRDGNACDLLAMVTGNRVACGQAYDTRYTIGLNKRGCSVLGCLDSHGEPQNKNGQAFVR